MCKLEIKNLSYIYDKLSGGSFLLKVPDFVLTQGDFLAVVGENGVGKSTFARIVAGLLKPTSGKIYFNGTDILKFLRKNKQNRFQIGVVFQFPEDQIFMDSVYKDLSFGLNNMKIPPDDVGKRVDNILNLVGLGKSFCEKSTLELSFGEKRKVAIAGIMVLSPKILILDEPTAGLDAISSKNILNKIFKYCKTNNAIVILICHNLEQILEFSNKFLVLKNGKGNFFGNVKDFLKFSNLKGSSIPIPKHLEVLEILKEKGYDISLDDVVDTQKAAESVFNFILSRRGKNNIC